MNDFPGRIAMFLFGQFVAQIAAPRILELFAFNVWSGPFAGQGFVVECAFCDQRADPPLFFSGLLTASELVFIQFCHGLVPQPPGSVDLGFAHGPPSR